MEEEMKLSCPSLVAEMPGLEEPGWSNGKLNDPPYLCLALCTFPLLCLFQRIPACLFITRRNTALTDSWGQEWWYDPIMLFRHLQK
jgi:hypothetical protein